MGGAKGHGGASVATSAEHLMPDPQVPLDSPLCGAPVVYVRGEDDTHFYRCSHHGSVILPPD